MKKFYKPFGFLIIILTSCNSFLDVKPDQKLVIPSTLQDLQAINDSGTNMLYPAGMDNASDDYYLTETNFNSIFDVQARAMYVWDETAESDFDWQYQYRLIFEANVVLDQLPKVSLNGLTELDRQQIKGAALFKRSHALFNLLLEYALPYEQDKLDLPGVPLRLNSSIHEKITRSTIGECFEQILTDLNTAVTFLPENALFKTRPSKTAALALLSRIYLYQQEYNQALAAVDEAFKLNHTLIDYNSLNTNAANPFVRFNEETLFYAISSGRGGLLNPAKALVNEALFNSYDDSDLRRLLYYKAAVGGHSFKGDYSGQSYGQLFHGLTTDELYLTKAECETRLNQISNAVKTLNDLLIKRYKSGAYTPLRDNLNRDALLTVILKERRKELAFRGTIRWMDFKRLINDSANKFIMTRSVGNQNYQIAPEDLKVAYLIPGNVIQLSGIAQNIR